MTDNKQIEGLEAYRDDPGYTSPEMQPGKGEVNTTDANAEFGVLAGTAMTIGVGGGVLAGQVLVDEVEEEQAQMTPNPDPEA